jgi:monothiol glutaredoxin
MDANEAQSKIKDQIKDNPILIYMKGSPYEPQCGFSARTVQALIECQAEFSYVDVLSNPDVRQNLPIVSEWPTFPQLYIGGELVGGCDIVTQLHASGELKKLVDSVAT